MKKKIKSAITIFINIFILLWKSSKLYFIGMIVTNVIIGLLFSGQMIVWKKIIDAVQTGIIADMILGIIIYLVISIIQNAVDQACQYYKINLSNHTNKYITNKILEKTKSISLKQYGSAGIHDKIKKANEESSGRTMNLLYSAGMLIKGISIFVSTALILISFSVPVMIICLITSVPMLLLGMKIAIKQYEIYNERFENMRFIEHIKNMLTKYENIKEIKVYKVTDYFIKHINKSFDKYIAEDKKIRKKFAFKNTGVAFLENVIIYCVKVAVGIKVILYKMTIGDWTLYISAIDNFKNSISNILSVITTIYEDGLYVNNFFDLMKLNTENNATYKFNTCFKRIVFENVWFKYPEADQYIIKGIDLEIEKGKNYAIVGLNGSGKTTILKLLLRLYVPTKGRILVDDMDIMDIQEDDYYNYVAAVFQDFIKYPVTVRENIALGDVNRLEDEYCIKEAAKKSGIYSYISSLKNEFNTQLQMEWTNATELSLGQWQKLAISRALFKNAMIVILDEPTASLDPIAEVEISDNIRTLMEGKTCILIAHRFSTVKLVDNIYVIKDGNIEEFGSHDELMEKNGEYARLYNIQAQGYLN